MRNEYIRGTHTLVDDFIRTVRTVVPSGTLNEVGLAEWTPHDDFDATIAWRVGDGPQLSLALKIDWTPQTGLTLKPTDRLPSTTVPVLLAPYLSPTLRKQVSAQGWSYWDATGNVRIHHPAPLILIEREGAARNPDANPEARGLLSLKGVGAARVVEYLLTFPNRGAVHDIARETGVGVGTVSRVISLLRDENFFMPTGGPGVHIEDRTALARRLAEDYDFVRSNRAQRYFSPLGREGVPMALRRHGIRFAVTGLKGAAEYLASSSTPARHPSSDLWLYVEDQSTAERVAQLEPDSRQGDIYVAEAAWMFESQNYYSGPLPRAYPWRIAFDLMSRPGRHAAVGEDLLSRLVESTE